MAEACIVCLGDLRTSIANDTSSDTPEEAARKGADDSSSEDAKPLLRNTRLSTKRYHT